MVQGVLCYRHFIVHHFLMPTFGWKLVEAIYLDFIFSIKIACVTGAALVQYFLMAAFCWMLVEGIYLYLFVVKVYNVSSKVTIYHCFSWGKPFYILIVITSSIYINFQLSDYMSSFTRLSIFYSEESLGRDETLRPTSHELCQSIGLIQDNVICSKFTTNYFQTSATFRQFSSG